MPQGADFIGQPASSVSTKVYPRDTKGKTKQTFVKTKCLIAVVAIVSLAWTVWIVFLNIAPNDTVNYVMNTKTFDNGSFWLMAAAPDALVILTTFGLAIVAFGFFGVVVKLIWQRSPKQKNLLRKSPTKVDVLTTKVTKALEDAATDRTGSKVSSVVKLATSLAHDDSHAMKRIKLGIKCGDLALETLLLYQILETGSPTPLVGMFTTVVVANALCCAGLMFVPLERAPLAETLMDLIFDFVIAVGCPVVVVMYCFSTYSLDRARLAINLEVFPPGSFERNAYVIASPFETASIYGNLKGLRVMSVLSFFTRVGIKASLCLRSWQAVDFVSSANTKKRQSSKYPKGSRLGAALLLIFAIALMIFVEESTRTSSLACQPHPECAVKAHRWVLLDTDSLTQCPCLILIDREIAPKTYAEWVNPSNVTEKVAQLATTGDLQAIELTNRHLFAFPEELRGCTNMRHISLEFTNTLTMPVWAKEFTKLEFLHVENAMVFLPDELFDDMTSLTFLHLTGFFVPRKLPSFDGLTNLKSLTLAVFLHLEELPSFDSLHNLERLVLVSLPELNTLPDFASRLKSFGTMDRVLGAATGFSGVASSKTRNVECTPCGGPSGYVFTFRRKSPSSNTGDREEVPFQQLRPRPPA